MANLQGWHFIILLVVILLLFGAAKLPALAKSMGQSARVFKGEMNALKDDDAKRSNTDAPAVDGTVTNEAATPAPTQAPPKPTDPTA